MFKLQLIVLYRSSRPSYILTRQTKTDLYTPIGTMASSLRGSQTICGAFSKAASPRYVCHSCRQNLLRPRGQQLRAASTSLSSGRARRSQGLSELQSCPRASYATKSFVDYIHPEKEQRVQGFLEGNPEDEVIYEEATTWVGIESVGQERHLGDRQPSADAFKP